MSSHVRVGLIGPDISKTPGGMSTASLGLLQAAKRSGGSVSYHFIPSHVEGTRSDHLSVFSRAVASLWRNRAQIDAVHLQVASRGSIERKLVFLLIVKLLGIPVLVQFHGADQESDFQRSRWHRLSYRLLVAHADTVATLGERLREWCVAALQCEPSKVVVLPNFLNTACAPALGEPNPADARPEFSFIVVGRLGTRKGTYDLISAMQRCRDRGDVSFVVRFVGDGDLQQVSEMLDRCEMTTGNVRGLVEGWQDPDKVERLLAKSDCFVLPSKAEGLPMAILEAMSARKAVIATDVGAVSDAVVDRRSGWLVPPNDVAALADAMIEAAMSRDRTHALGEHGHRRLVDKFAEARVFPLYRESYLAIT